MAEEDLKSLQSLVSNKQKKTFTRMLSQEFSCPESHTPVQGGRRRRKSKKSSTSSETIEDASETPSPDQVFQDPSPNVIGDEHDESDESEYFSAEEEHDEHFLDATISTDSSNDDVESEHCAEVESTYKSNFPTGSEHRRASSKRQKRKRKELAKLNPIFPFENAEYIDIDFPELREEISLTASRSIFTEVPSLVELCVTATRKLPRDCLTDKIPGRIKQILRISNNRLGLQKIQLSWLLQLLPLIEKCDTIFDKHEKKPHKIPKIPFSYRNIWCSEMYSSQLLEHQEAYNLAHSYHTCFLPHTFIWSIKGYDETRYQANHLQLSVLANVIDLMLPPTVPHKLVSRKRQASSQSDEDLLSAKTDWLVSQVKLKLEKEFPQTIKHFYHHVLPYVFWARGLLPKAARLFSDLAASEVKHRRKARYLYEVGRMYSHFDEAETAIVFYKGAEDAILAKTKKRTDTQIQMVQQQTRGLCADACDQGPMTWQKAQQARLAWTTAVLSPDAGKQFGCPLPGMFAADSLLCFHAGIGKDDVKAWLSSCVDYLVKISECCPEVYLYLSQVYAWAGLAKDSATAYRTYLQKGDRSDSGTAPGQISASLSRPERQPWKALLQVVQCTGPPKPLSVLWRTRLGPPRFYNVNDKRGSWEADLKSADVNLTLSKDGKITGDLQMVLPPIRGVQLDPYTGILCFPHLPGETVPWQSYYEFTRNNLEAYGPTLMPTPVDLYCDHHGNRVHLLRTSEMVDTNTHTVSTLDSNLLFWTGADGRKSKIDLRKKVRYFVYKETQKKLFNSFASDLEKYEKSKLLLEKCYKAGNIMDAQGIESHMYAEEQRKKMKRPENKYSPARFACNVMTPARFSSTVVIPVFYPFHYPQSKCLVFVNCSSLEAFLEPKICRCSSFQGFFPEDSFRNGEGYVPRMLNMPHADLIPVSLSFSDVMYYDQFGEEFDKLHLSNVNMESGLPQVYRNQVYYLSENNSIITRLNGVETNLEHFDFVDKMVVCRNVIIMVNSGRLVFADSLNFLPLEILICDKIRPSLPNGVDCKGIKFLKVIGEKEFVMDSGIKCNQVAIVLDTHLVVVEIPLCEEPEIITMTLCVEVPGLPTDICFISQHAGVLVSVTQHATSKFFPRETLYYFDYNGNLHGLLPGLGKGPRSFLPLMLPVSTEGEESNKSAWHIYMRDGHDGILCVRLDS